MNEENAIHKTEPKTKLLLLIALGIMLIGLTICNAPIIYSQPSPDAEIAEADGEAGEEEADDEEVDEDKMKQK